MRAARFIAALVLGIVVTVGFAEDGSDSNSTPSFDAIRDKAAAAREKLGIPGMSVGVVHDGKLVWAEGFGEADREEGRAATPDSIYAIGSATKVFTTTLLVVLRDAGIVRLDDSLASHLPPGARVPKSADGPPPITLRSLATQTSGLPRLPSNIDGPNTDPYNNFTEEQMLHGLTTAAMSRFPGEGYEYSNFGMGVLGYVLGKADGSDYRTSLRTRVLDPLAMNATYFDRADVPAEHWAIGHGGEGKTAKPVPDWHLGTLEPAGCLCSSVNDLAKFLVAHMATRATDAGPRLLAPGSLAEMHAVQRLAGSWEMGIGLGWHIKKGAKHGDMVWHNGMVAGHTSFIGFIPEARTGIIVLANRATSVDHLAEELLFAALDVVGPPAPAAVPEEVTAVAVRILDLLDDPTKEKLPKLFAPGFLKHVPVDMMLAQLTMIRKTSGKVVHHELTHGAEEGTFKLLVTYDAGGRIGANFAFDGSEPPLVTYLLMAPE